MSDPATVLRRILIIVTVLTVPLGFVATGDDDWALLGVIVLFPTSGGCIAHVIGGGKGRSFVGVLIGFIAIDVLMFVLRVLRAL